jgi:hypothetical protein
MTKQALNQPQTQKALLITLTMPIYAIPSSQQALLLQLLPIKDYVLSKTRAADAAVIERI